MICRDCDRYCSWVGRHGDVNIYGCVDGCGARWEGPEPHCVDFMSDDDETTEKERAA